MGHSYWKSQPDVQGLVHLKDGLLARVPGAPWASYFLLQKKKALIIPSMRRAEKSKVVAWKDISSVATGMSKRKFPLPGCMGKEF